MNTTIIAVLLFVLAVLFFAYLFKVLSEGDITENGKCDAEDYEISDKIAARK